MKILQIHKFYHVEGGAERYYLELSKVLERHGHEVAYFSMQDPRNFKSKWNKYFVSNMSFRNIDYRLGLKIIGRMIYSLEAKKKINQLLDIFHPDIVHIHNIYNHISPSILLEIKKRDIPIVQTVHDYSLLTPNYFMFHNGHICEITKKTSYYKAIFHKCIKNSYAASALTALTMYIHKIFGLYSKYVDYYIAPSLFMKKKMVEYGFDEKKIIHLPHFVTPKPINKLNSQSKKKYILYFGRLSPEKGLLFLLQVAQRLPGINFKIIGNGSQRTSIFKYIRRYSVLNVELLDFQLDNELHNSICKSTFTIMPSLWYEPFGLSIIESVSLGKPVIASNIGGIPEQLISGKNGLLFEPNNIEDCISKVSLLWNDLQLLHRLSMTCIEFTTKKYNSDYHFQGLMKIYNLALRKRKKYIQNSSING